MIVVPCLFLRCRRPCLGILTYLCSCARVLLEQYVAVEEPQQLTGVRVQLQSSFGLVLLLSVAADAAAADSSRVLVTAWIQDMRKRCIHHIIYLVDCFEYLSAIHHLFIRSSYPVQE